MNPFAFFWKSSIGKKWLVAITGLIWVGYVIAHMAGNLQIFAGPDLINNYAKLLHSMPPVLWLARIVLIIAFVLHVVATIKLAAENRAARPEAYQKRAHVQATLASRTMILSGPVILCFLIYHILHFTTHSVDPTYGHWVDPAGRHDVYRMLVVGFQNPLASFFYALGVVLLMMHLSHGISSLTQTFGVNSRKTMSLFTWGGRAMALAIGLGFLSVPAAVLLGGMGKAYVAERQAASSVAPQEIGQQ